MGTVAPTVDNTDARAYIRGAFAENRFTLYCQPLLSLKDDVRYPLAEVLVRMSEEESAMLPPGDFLPLMEEMGVLPELDRWVVRQAVSQLVGGLVVGKLCLNVSLPTLQEEDFPEFVAREARFAGVSPAALVFELQESDALASAAARRFVHGIRRAGAAVALEDFRCEEVSFELLRALRADYLKLEGGIVRKLCTSEAAKAALRAAVAAAAPAGVRVVAESVEDLPTLAAAVRLGADFAQGYGVYAAAPIGAWRR